MATIKGIGLAKIVLTRGAKGLGFTAIVTMDGEAIGKIEDWGDGVPITIIHPEKEDEFTKRMNKYYATEGVTFFSPDMFLEEIRLLGSLEKVFATKTRTNAGSLHKIKPGILVVGSIEQEHIVDDMRYTIYTQVLSVMIYTTSLEHAIEKATSMVSIELDRIKTYTSAESFNIL